MENITITEKNINQFKLAMTFSSEDSVRQSLKHIRIESATVVATDGHRLCLFNDFCINPNASVIYLAKVKPTIARSITSIEIVFNEDNKTANIECYDKKRQLKKVIPTTYKTDDDFIYPDYQGVIDSISNDNAAKEIIGINGRYLADISDCCYEEYAGLKLINKENHIEIDCELTISSDDLIIIMQMKV